MTAAVSFGEQLHATMADYVRRRDVPGVVTLVSRHGRVRRPVQSAVVGVGTIGGPAIQRDAIFRVTSLSKPIISAAAMVLVDDGVLRLDEPVDRFLPELADRRVLHRLNSPLDDTVPAARPITVRDLLTSRMGFGIVMARAERYPIQRALRELEICVGPPNPQAPHTPDEWMRRLGMLPLMHQPGERWMYSTSYDVLGVLVARASGHSLETFLRARLLAPLGMRDTAFSLPPSKLNRFVSCYRAHPTTGALTVVDAAATSQWSAPPKFPAGRDGLVSTADDYLAFGQMLLARGIHAGQQVLSRKAVALMTMNHLTAEQKSESVLLSGGRGWGFGMAVTPYWFGWDGGFGTSWRTYERAGIVAVLMTQRLVVPVSSGIDDEFWTIVEGTLGDQEH